MPYFSSRQRPNEGKLDQLLDILSDTTSARLPTDQVSLHSTALSNGILQLIANNNLRALNDLILALPQCNSAILERIELQLREETQLRLRTGKNPGTLSKLIETATALSRCVLINSGDDLKPKSESWYCHRATEDLVRSRKYQKVASILGPLLNEHPRWFTTGDALLIANAHSAIGDRYKNLKIYDAIINGQFKETTERALHEVYISKGYVLLKQNKAKALEYVRALNIPGSSSARASYLCLSAYCGLYREPDERKRVATELRGLFNEDNDNERIGKVIDMLSRPWYEYPNKPRNGRKLTDRRRSRGRRYAYSG